MGVTGSIIVGAATSAAAAKLSGADTKDTLKAAAGGALLGGVGAALGGAGAGAAEAAEKVGETGAKVATEAGLQTATDAGAKAAVEGATTAGAEGAAEAGAEGAATAGAETAAGAGAMEDTSGAEATSQASRFEKGVDAVKRGFANGYDAVKKGGKALTMYAASRLGQAFANPKSKVESKGDAQLNAGKAPQGERSSDRVNNTIKTQKSKQRTFTQQVGDSFMKGMVGDDIARHEDGTIDYGSSFENYWNRKHPNLAKAWKED